MYRLYEISLGLAAWITLIALLVSSWALPEYVAIFIILFDTYWLLKTFYLFLHLKHSYSRLKENIKIDWSERLKADFPNEKNSLWHLIIIPAYREPINNLRNCLESIKNESYPNEKKLVVLALEERAGEDDQVIGRTLTSEFSPSFDSFLVTTHPKNIEGEVPGKGSNQCYSAKEAKKLIIDKKQLPYEKIITTILDSDSRLEKDYLSILSHRFLSSRNSLRQSYQPIPVFTNNIYNVSFVSRILSFSCTFWQLMQQARKTELTTFSSHSMPWKALVDVGFYDTRFVSEDSHIFFQCLLHYKGDYRVDPIEYPVYMDSVEGRNIWQVIKNQYRQQRRWAWGAENLAYVFDNFRKPDHKNIPRKIKNFWRIRLWTGLYSWSTASLILFLFGWLPLLIGKRAFQSSVLAYNLPIYTSTIMNISVIGIVISAVLSTTLLPEKEKQFTKIGYLLYLLPWIFTPIAFVILSGIPALDAQTRLALGGKWRLGFWRTPKTGRT